MEGSNEQSINGRLRRAVVFAAALSCVVSLQAMADRASAATVEVQGDVLVFSAAPGETNRVSIDYLSFRSPPSWEVSQFRDGASLTPGPGCAMTDQTPGRDIVGCPAAGINSVRVELGDGDDRVGATAADRPIPFSVQGGDGNDFLAGAEGNDVINGGAGNDEVNRAVGATGQGGNDQINGGPGDDQILAGIGTETISGDEGADYVVGGGRKDKIFGNAGNDHLRGGATTKGGAGNDKLVGGAKMYGEKGKDTLEANESSKLLSGGDSADKLFGSIGISTIIGGKGKDNVRGGAGNENIRVKDGEKDTVSCGKGADAVSADGSDLVGSGCESVKR